MNEKRKAARALRIKLAKEQEAARRKASTYLEDAQKRARALRDKLFKNAPRPGEKALKLRQTRLEDVAARSEKLRRELFGEKKLAAAEAKARVYDAARKAQVKLTGTKLEDVAARSAELRRKLFKLDAEAEALKEQGAAAKREPAGNGQQAPKEKGRFKGSVVAMFNQAEFVDRLDAALARVVLISAQVQAMKDDLQDAYGGGAASIVTGYNLPFGFAVLSDEITLVQAGIRVLGKGKRE